jgi:hypothetical protein
MVAEAAAQLRQAEPGKRILIYGAGHGRSDAPPGNPVELPIAL